MAGTCTGSLINELFADSSSTRNDWLLAAADFQFVPVGIFKKESVVSRTVFGAHFRTFQILAADLTNQFRNLVYSVTRVGPERNSRSVWLMMSVFSETKKLRR